MKPFHRILAIFASVLILFVAATGTMMEVLDLNALLRGAHEADRTMQSINEGKFGNGPYMAITERDFSGDALPAGLNIADAFKALQAGLARQHAKPDADFLELRVVDGRVIGQAKYGKALKAVDIATGNPVPQVDVRPFGPPPSLRQTMKEWHRFWGPSVKIGHGDKPAVYIELAVGLCLCALIGSGASVYVRLYRQRRKIKRPNPFWMAGGAWRALHRVVAAGSLLFVSVMALSGTFIGFESSWHTFVPRPVPRQVTPLPADAVPQMVAATLGALARDEPGVALRTIRLRDYYGYREGVVITKEPVTRQLVYDTATGQAQSLEAPNYPDSQFPFGMDVHEAVKHFHSGYTFGIPARVMALLSGAALIYLGVSGVWMYIDLWLKRRRSGRNSFFWKG